MRGGLILAVKQEKPNTAGANNFGPRTPEQTTMKTAEKKPTAQNARSTEALQATGKRGRDQEEG